MASEIPTALVLVDIQNDFLPPDGTLAVPDGDKILPIVMTLLDYKWSLVVASADCTPFRPLSAKEPFQSIEVPAPDNTKITQALWPDHCVGGQPGARFETSVSMKLKGLMNSGAKVHLVKKGKAIDVDAYSAFAGSVHSGHTQLKQVLNDNNINRIVIVGELITSEEDMQTDGTRAVNSVEGEGVFKELEGLGVHLMTLKEFQDRTSSPVEPAHLQQGLDQPGALNEDNR
ncbi:NAD(+) salvage pathway protein [Tulasnella sp. 330]|nr:NAD(+) salvage pathway protein [Tulasnella sp. 330]KAG8890589.1 NAD(+) salvage pathway protein [Tulasnella sp. 332]